MERERTTGTRQLKAFALSVPTAAEATQPAKTPVDVI